MDAVKLQRSKDQNMYLATLGYLFMYIFFSTCFFYRTIVVVLICHGGNALSISFFFPSPPRLFVVAMLAWMP